MAALALARWSTRRFECPVCGYLGPFLDLRRPTGKRRHARCPWCGAKERHRLQYLVLQSLLKGWDASDKRMLHVAPERFFRDFFAERFGCYETCDLHAHKRGVDHEAKLEALPFEDASYDFLFASHVLEHVREDLAAIRELHRVLRPGGLAILTVPVVAERTVEYPAPNPRESDHVRAPGRDYFDRYRRFFRRVDLHTSEAFPERYQLYSYEDRSRWPTPECPWRPPTPGERHIEIVPVCHA